MTCPDCRVEAVVVEVLDPQCGLTWEWTTCPKCGRVLLMRQKHPPMAPSRPADDGDEE